MNSGHGRRPLNQRSHIWRFIFWQSTWVVFCIDVGALWSGFPATIACVAAGIAVLLPQMIFVVLYFKHSGAQSARKVVNAFYLGEMLKLILTAVLIGLALSIVKPHMGWFLLTMFGAYAAYGWVPLCLERNI